MSIEAARGVIAAAIARHVFPGAAIEVGGANGLLWSEQLGALTFDAGAPAAVHDTIYDLASLTKAIATTTIAMELVRRDALQLEARVGAFVDDWIAVDREDVTVRDLLEHASGLPARLVDLPPATSREFEHDICTIRLEYEPRTRSIYSDLGFILLGMLLERAAGAPLDALFERIVRIGAVRRDADTTGVDRTVPESPSRFAFDDLPAFGVPQDARRRAAPTEPLKEDLRHGRRLIGEVHDNYAAALGGVAGHAGLFATASGVGAFARHVLAAAIGRDPLTQRFITRSAVPGSSRALGWDTMLPTSSCGERMSASAFGHVGFTGTSLWLDPDRDRYFVLLTNRVCGGGTLDDMRAVRRAFHDALGDV
jgi:CubicO group peptidase (beta-lactamase class C family)